MIGVIILTFYVVCGGVVLSLLYGIPQIRSFVENEKIQLWLVLIVWPYPALLFLIESIKTYVTLLKEKPYEDKKQLKFDFIEK